MPKNVQIQAFHDKNGHLTEFAGFNLPLWFKGIIPESLAVRNAAGIFDVSHMGRALVRGRDSLRFLNHITTNDVSSLTNGAGQYSLLCNPVGGIKDDVLIFNLQPDQYLIVYNAANRASDYEWFTSTKEGFDVEVEDISDTVAMFAVQGPKAVTLMSKLADAQLGDLPRFACNWAEIAGSKVLLSRTGYTGEDGFEVFVWDAPIGNAIKAQKVWDRILEEGKPVGLEPCGLGARDLLRLEAGLCLYGTDMNENTNPFEARLGFVVKLSKDFIGKSSLLEVKGKGPRKLRVGLVTENRVIPRHGFSIHLKEEEIGHVTSGTLSPLLDKGIALAYTTPQNANPGNVVQVRIRDRFEEAKLVKTPFYDTNKYGYSRRTNSV
ncbi:MAG: glycine cleavage system aminomethyltransferase GcvT [Candidatus Bathyarchaeia archaeon]